jgi:hypothetical protein
MNNDLEIIKKEVVVATLEAFSGYLTLVTEETQ